MGIIGDKNRAGLEKAFEELDGKVNLVVFSQETECQFCKETRGICEELAEISDRIETQVYDFVADEEQVKAYGIDKIPAIAVTGEKDHGIRFYGIPAGYEFATLVETIIGVSKGDHGLPDDLAAELAKVDEPVKLQVMVTPT